MKKYILLAIILLFPLVGFGNDYGINCIKIPVTVNEESAISSLHRCENTEIVCYLSESNIQCKFKEEKPKRTVVNIPFK